jgi:hypothetical protein
LCSSLALSLSLSVLGIPTNCYSSVAASDPDVAAKCQTLAAKSDEEKLHCMLDEKFWGVDVDEESGLHYGPFKHAFKCMAKYVSAAWKERNVHAHAVVDIA